MSDRYLTLATPSEGLYKEKMSKFISFAIPVESVAEAKEQINNYQKRYHDARHVCWAYMVGPRRTDHLSSDNGEPSGTAGKPILGQINSFGLTNVVVIVVRYFGGIKLGTSGLIVAYREAARQAIEASTIVERHEMIDITFSFPYLAMNDVMKLLKSGEVEIKHQIFDNACEMVLSVRLDDYDTLRERLADIDGVTFAQ